MEGRPTHEAVQAHRRTQTRTTMAWWAFGCVAGLGTLVLMAAVFWTPQQGGDDAQQAAFARWDTRLTWIGFTLLGAAVASCAWGATAVTWRVLARMRHGRVLRDAQTWLANGRITASEFEELQRNAREDEPLAGRADWAVAAAWAAAAAFGIAILASGAAAKARVCDPGALAERPAVCAAWTDGRALAEEWSQLAFVITAISAGTSLWLWLRPGRSAPSVRQRATLLARRASERAPAR